MDPFFILWMQLVGIMLAGIPLGPAARSTTMVGMQRVPNDCWLYLFLNVMKPLAE